MFQIKPFAAPATALLACLWLGNALALSSDKDQPIEVNADAASIDEGKGISTYTGNVEMDQGSMHLQADKVVVYHEGGVLQRLVATGSLVHFRQLPDGKKNYVKGRARHLDYDFRNDNIVLTDEAVVIQGQDTFRSDRIIYDAVKSMVKGGASAQGKERVHLTIQPKKQ